MSRRRRAVLLLGLSLVLGGISASSVSRREAALKDSLGPSLPVVVAKEVLSAGEKLTPKSLAVRKVPSRYLPAGVFSSPAQAVGLRTAVPVAAGGYLGPGLLVQEGQDGADGLGLKAGQRVVEVVGSGSIETVVPGSRVDLVVADQATESGRGEARLVLEDTQVVAARATVGGATGSGAGEGLEQIAVSLRVNVRQAVYLAGVQSFGRRITFLPRGMGDSKRGYLGLRVGSTDG